MTNKCTECGINNEELTSCASCGYLVHAELKAAKAENERLVKALFDADELHLADEQSMRNIWALYDRSTAEWERQTAELRNALQTAIARLAAENQRADAFEGLLERCLPYIKTISRSANAAYEEEDPSLYEEMKAAIATKGSPNSSLKGLDTQST